MLSFTTWYLQQTDREFYHEFIFYPWHNVYSVSNSDAVLTSLPTEPVKQQSQWNGALIVATRGNVEIIFNRGWVNGLWKQKPCFFCFHLLPTSSKIHLTFTGIFKCSILLLDSLCTSIPINEHLMLGNEYLRRHNYSLKIYVHFFHLKVILTPNNFS